MRQHRLFERLMLGALALLAGWFYFWCARQPAGSFLSHGPEGYYGWQTEGFRQGHLAVALTPNPNLAALPDPYDPVANAPYRVHDMSFYRGKYYLYFGVVPVLVLFWPYAALTGGYLTEAFAAGWFCFVGFCAGLILLARLRERHCPRVAAGWMLAAGMAWGLGNYVVILLQRPGFYQVPIAGAFAFLMLGLLALEAGLRASSPGKTAGWLAGASVCFGLCLGCRPNYVLATLALALICGRAIWSWRGPKGIWSARSLGLLAATFGPVGLLGAGLLAYNYARFGSPGEFGMHYQLAGERIGQVALLSARYIPHNLAFYLFNAGRWSPYFPFLELDPMAVLGGLRYFWVGWLGVFAFLPLGTRDDSDRRVFAAAVLLAGLALLGLLSTFFGTTERYPPDFMPCLILLGCFGLLVLLERTATLPWRNGLKPILLASLLATTGSGLILFASHTPARGRQLAGIEKALNGFSYAWMKVSGRMPGAITLTAEFARTPAGEEEPLIESGSTLGRRDILSVVHLPENQVRFRLFHAGSGGVLGAPLAIEYGRRYKLEVLYGGLLPPELHPYYRGWSLSEIRAARGTVRVRLDGREVLWAAMQSYASRPGDVHLGWSAYPGGAVQPRFQGRLSVAEIRRLARADFALPAPEMSAGAKMTLLFPADRTGTSEPLLVNGSMRDCDLLYVRYTAPGRLRVGFDHYGSGGPQSKEVAYDPLAPQELAVWVGNWGDERDQAEDKAAGQRLLVVLNGEVLLDRENALPLRSGSHPLLGRNPYGSTTAELEFSGRILALTPLSPAQLPRYIPSRKVEGAVTITLHFPVNRLGAAEPLVTTGRTGEGDFIYVRYVDQHHVVFGFDHWGVGGLISQPILIAYDREHQVEVTLGSLYEPEDFTSKRRPAELQNLVQVRLDGQVVLETASPTYASTSEQRQVGINQIGGSTTGPNFTGELVDVKWVSAD